MNEAAPALTSFLIVLAIFSFRGCAGADRGVLKILESLTGERR